MKKLISLLAVIALMTVLATAAFATEEPALLIKDVEADPGDEVVMNIELVNNPGLTLGELVFEFDTDALEFVSAEAVGGEDWEWLPILNDDVDNAKFGSFVFSASAQPLTGDAVLLTLTLKVKDDVKPGKYEVNAVVDFIGDDDADFIVEETFTGYVVVPCAEHVWDDGVVKTAATCTEDGVMLYTCTLCGETKEETIAATGHAWEVTETVEATCFENGKVVYTCANCGETKEEVIEAANAHAWDEGVVKTEATCCTDGVMLYTCSACGETKEEAIAANGEHTWNEGEVKVAATCCENGLMVYTCVNGTATKEEVIAATGVHDYAYEAIDDVDHKVICKNSGKELDVEPHTFGDWIDDAENPGWKYQECDKCHYKLIDEPGQTGDNAMIAVAVAVMSMMGIALVVSKKKEF